MSTGKDPSAEHQADETTENAVRLWELVRDDPSVTTWDTARDSLGLTDDELRRAVNLVRKALRFERPREPAPV